jgi:putative tricarboxylic transport membrane protein
VSDRHAGDAGTADGGRHTSPARSSVINMTDLWVAIVVLSGVGLLWYHSTLWDELPAFVQRGLPPSLFPRIWLAAIAFMALFLPFEQYLQGERGKELDKDRAHSVKPITYLTMLVMVPISASMEWLGSVVVIVLICVVLPLIWGERRWHILIPYVLLFPPAVIFLFKVAFKVNFEPGVLGLGFK